MRTNENLAARAAISVLLMVGFYVLAFVLIAGLIAIPVAVYLESGRVNSRLVKVGVFCLVAAGTIFWAILPRRDKFEKPGLFLRKTEQPDLFAEIEEVARLTQQAMPTEIYLVGDVNAFVAQREDFMGFGGKRVMGLGLPLMRIMSKAQFRGVIAHEFGHFHGGDTRLGPWVYKTHAALGRTITKLEESDTFLDRPFKWYGKLFLRITSGISRAQEYAADALSARINGAAPLISGLSLLPGSATLFPGYVTDELIPVLDQGRRPPFAAGFQQFLDSERGRELSASFTEEALAEANSHPYDSHPPLRQRIEALSDGPSMAPSQAPSMGTEGEAVDDVSPAIDLLRDLPELEARLLAFMFDNEGIADMVPLDWSEVAEEVWLRKWQESWASQSSAVEGWLVDDLPARREELSDLGRVFGGENLPPSEWKNCTVWYLGLGLGLILHRKGFDLEYALGENVVLVRGDERIQPQEEIRALVEDPEASAGWSSKLSAWGIAGEVLAEAPESSSLPGPDETRPDQGSEPARPGSSGQGASNPRVADQAAALAHINSKVGPIPRKIGRLDWRLYHKITMPFWDWEEDADEIGRVIENWERIHKEGEVRWASLIQANGLLFGENHLSLPGDVVVWCDETVAFDQVFIESVAGQLVALKGRSGELEDPSAQRYAKMLEEETVRVFGLPVPESIAQGIDLRIFTVFFQILHMPEGVLADSSFPVFHLAEPETVAMVPYEYWPKGMQKEWTRVAKQMIKEQKREDKES
jgi:heat shock protein HtpX